MILACQCDARNLSICSAVFCVGVDEVDCPGNYTKYDPDNGICCSTCTVTKDLGESCKAENFRIGVVCKSPYVCKNDVCSE